MKLFSYEVNGRTGLGLWTERGVRDISAAGGPASMQGLIFGGATALAEIHALAASAPTCPDGYRIVAPLPRPVRDIFCVGKNYREHAREFGQSGFDGGAKGGDEIPDAPIIFSKATTSVSASGDPILGFLDQDGTLDYEGELAVVIGHGGRGIKRAEALGHVFGYTIVNDVTAREAQKRHKQWVIGKGADSFCPMGPLLVTADDIPDPSVLKLETWVNGELRQSGVVSDLIFDIPTLIETISAAITLLPGDVIATGTPAGVGIGFNPPKYLRSGDKVDVRIDPIGLLTNTVQ